MKYKTKLTYLIILTLVISMFPMSSSNEVDYEIQDEYTLHDDILIEYNSDFTVENGVTSGSGTQGDPYIISGWKVANVEIAAPYFQIITKYYRVEKCMITNELYLARESEDRGNISSCHFNGGYINLQNGDGNPHNIFIFNCSFYNMKSHDGLNIGIWATSNCSILNSNFSGGGNGIIVTNAGPYVLIKNCIFIGTEYAISAMSGGSQITIEDCYIANTTGYAISTKANNTLIQNCTIVNCMYGVTFSSEWADYHYSLSNVTIRNCSFNYSGLELFYEHGYSTNILVENCYFNQSYSWEVGDNSYYYYLPMVILKKVRDSIIRNCYFLNSNYSSGNSSSWSWLNRLKSIGFSLQIDTNNCTVHSNHITGFMGGIVGEETKESATNIRDNLFYNNYLCNVKNIYYNEYYNYHNITQNQTWNISKTAGTNIIGGTNLGGNYWADYNGVDGNADGICDTPYQSDALPLYLGYASLDAPSTLVVEKIGDDIFLLTWNNASNSERTYIERTQDSTDWDAGDGQPRYFGIEQSYIDVCSFTKPRYQAWSWNSTVGASPTFAKKYVSYVNLVNLGSYGLNWYANVKVGAVAAWSNSTGVTSETVTLNVNAGNLPLVSDINIWMDGLVYAGNLIDGNMITLYVSSDNTSFNILNYSAGYGNGIICSGGCNMTINATTWPTPGDNPWSIHGNNDVITENCTIYVRFKTDFIDSLTRANFSNKSRWIIYAYNKSFGMLDYTNFSGLTEIDANNSVPRFVWTYPEKGATNVPLPLTNISAYVIDDDGNSINLTFYTTKAPNDSWGEYYNRIGNVTDIANSTVLSNQTFNISEWYNTRWRWGDTTYYWSVNLSDFVGWGNFTFSFTTEGSRYDVTTSGDVVFQDAIDTWDNRVGAQSYRGIYDVDASGDVTINDAIDVWDNRT